MNKVRIFPDVECGTCQNGCECGDEERALRRIADGSWELGPMTQDQRQWSIDEANSAGEGSWSTPELEKLSDKELANAVISAWWDYVRSNCMG